jgi:branched-subunit amino acid aminotransferase/4-amino-4-deoxychorismate lyase
LTPSLECGLLAGITRQLLIELAPHIGRRIIETELTPSQLTSASEAFLTNAVSGLRPLVAVNGQPIGNGQPGTVFTQLSLAYQQFCSQASQKPPIQESL